jgi:hypothetical protein
MIVNNRVLYNRVSLYITTYRNLGVRGEDWDRRQKRAGPSLPRKGRSLTGVASTMETLVWTFSTVWFIDLGKLNLLLAVWL